MFLLEMNQLRGGNRSCAASHQPIINIFFNTKCFMSYKLFTVTDFYVLFQMLKKKKAKDRTWTVWKAV